MQVVASRKEMESHSLYRAAFYRMFPNGYPNTRLYLRVETVAAAENNI